jgi:hypothetical protein
MNKMTMKMILVKRKRSKVREGGGAVNEEV